jgi:hypothetical protein
MTGCEHEEMQVAADNLTGLNDQYGMPLFGVTGNYVNTGFGGSQGDSAAETEGPVIGSPVVSSPLGSSQLAVNTPRLDVTAGDTSGMSSDTAVGDNFPKLAGGPVAGMTVTNIGTGHVGGPRHPNAIAPGPEV